VEFIGDGLAELGPFVGGPFPNNAGGFGGGQIGQRILVVINEELVPAEVGGGLVALPADTE